MIKKIVFCFLVILSLSGCGEEHRFMTLCRNEGSAVPCKCMYNEISKIKVIDVNKIEGDKTIVVKIEYLDKKFKIETHYDDDRRDFYFFRLSNEFKKNFKNKMGIITDSDTLTDYLKDKTKEFIKKNNISL